MKRILRIMLCILLVLALSVPCLASEINEGCVVYSHVETLENGITLMRETILIDAHSRSVTKAYTDKHTYSRNGEIIAEIWIDATFRYDGNTVSVVSKSISKCETYDGWSFKQSSFTSSGGTVTLTGKLTKLLVLNANINISLTCDKNGNIS